MSITRQLIRGNNTSVEAATLLAAQYAFDTTKNEATVGTGAVAGGVRLAKKNIGEIMIAAQLVANTNDYNPTNVKHARTLIISTDAARDLTGMVPSSPGDTTDGREITLYNGGSFNATLKDQNASSSAANRFDLGGADLVMAPKVSVTLRYRTQGALNRWEMVSQTAGAAVSSGAVIARTLAGSAMGAFVGMINGTIVPSVAGSALTIALKTLAGVDPSAADPTYAIFRNATAATGDYTVLTITAATSFVMSSGSSGGVAANNTAFRLWGVGFNDAGTFRLGVINCLSGTSIYPLAGWGIASSTAEGGAGGADNAQTFYTGTAVAAKAYVPLCYMTWETGLAAAGTWSAGPTRTQLYGAGVPLPGAEIQQPGNATAAVATGTTLVPFDDTIPQNTEGDQYLSQAITPSSAANLLEVSAQLAYSPSVSNNCMVSLFQDTTANALATASQSNSAGWVVTTPISFRLLAALIVATTFKIRAGGSVSNTFTFNGTTGGRLFGGVSSSFIRIKEIMA